MSDWRKGRGRPNGKPLECLTIRSQVVHGLVPAQVDPDLVRYVTTTARHLVSGKDVA
jgi:hypothetical protein